MGGEGLGWVLPPIPWNKQRTKMKGETDTHYVKQEKYRSQLRISNWGMSVELNMTLIPNDLDEKIYISPI